MANASELKITVRADTDDAEKKLDEVAKAAETVSEAAAAYKTLARAGVASDHGRRASPQSFWGSEGEGLRLRKTNEKTVDISWNVNGL
ncbi:MAG: hypothetical protein ACI4QT_01220 [Kiritimatiellia bacterium]